MTLESCLDILNKERYSRYPLCQDGNPDQALGVIHFKDLYASRPF